MNQEPDETPAEPKEDETRFQKFLSRPWTGWAVFCFGVTFLGGGIEGVLALFGVDPILPAVVSVLASLALIFCGSMAGLAFFMNRTVVDHPLRRRLIVRGAIMSGLGFLLTSLSILIPAGFAAYNAAYGNHFSEQTFAGGRFAIEVPDSWEPDSSYGTIPDSLQLSDSPNDLHLLASAVRKADLTVSSLSELRRLQLKAITDYLEDAESEIIPGEQIDDTVRIDTVVRGSINGRRKWFYLRHLSSGEYWVEVQLWTSPSRLEEHGELLGHIANSFHRVETSP